jgi:hypothetical protein
MTDATPDYAPMFAALCIEAGFCLHPKGEARVIEALDRGIDSAVKAVFESEGVDYVTASGPLRRAVRDCIKANLPKE